MTDKRNNLMQEIEIYGNGLLSDETIERTADMIVELDPAPSTIDEIDIDQLNDIIQAVEEHGAEHMAPTDADRREVARRLRELDYSDLQESLICAYLDALGIDGYEDWVGIAHRLADLIEPEHHAEEIVAKAYRAAADQIS